MCTQSVRRVLSRLYESNYHRKQALFVFITLSWQATFNWTYCTLEYTGGIIKVPCIINCIKVNSGYVWVNTTFLCHQTKFSHQENATVQKNNTIWPISYIIESFSKITHCYCLQWQSYQPLSSCSCWNPHLLNTNSTKTTRLQLRI